MTHVKIVLAIALALFVPSLAQAQTTTETTKPPITSDIWKDDLVDRFKRPVDDLTSYVYSWTRVGWEQKCWDKVTKQWLTTSECTTGGGNVAFEAQIALVLCRLAEDDFRRSVFGTPLKWVSAEKLAAVQEGVAYCEAQARTALAELQ